MTKHILMLLPITMLAFHFRWFGNLVTLSWWDDLWLNEGFASFMEYKGVANYHSDWDMNSQFLTEDLHRVKLFGGLAIASSVTRFGNFV